MKREAESLLAVVVGYVTSTGGMLFMVDALKAFALGIFGAVGGLLVKVLYEYIKTKIKK